LIPQPSVDRLQEIGKWMAVNGESIHGVSASVIGRPQWGRCTVKGNKLYLHVFHWPTDGPLEVPAVPGQVEKAYLLADKKRTSLPVAASEKGLTVSVASQAPDSIDSVVVLVLKNK